MPVFNIAANTWKQPSYYEGKALRANARVNDAQAAMLEKRAGTYEEDRAIDIAMQKRQEDRLQEQAKIEEEKWQAEQQDRGAIIGVRAAKAGLEAYNSTKGTEEDKIAAGHAAAVASYDNDIPGGFKSLEDHLSKSGTPIKQFDPKAAKAIISGHIEKQDSAFESTLQGLQERGVISPEQADNYRIAAVEKQVADGTKSSKDLRETQAVKLLDDFDLESVNKWIKSGDFSDLVRRAGAEQVKLTASEQKGAGWYNQALSGAKFIDDNFERGLDIDKTKVYLYASSIDDSTSPMMRQVYRAALDQEDLNFFDGVTLLVDPVVRQSTGAAVKAFEFLEWFNATVPQTNDPAEIAQKKFFRERLVAGLRIAAGNGAEVVDKLHSEVPQPNFVEGKKEGSPQTVGVIPQEVGLGMYKQGLVTKDEYYEAYGEYPPEQ